MAPRCSTMVSRSSNHRRSHALRTGESMPETREPRSVVDAAEQAAAAGDYASAERLLRQAALLQEASLGPLHPDLANTLNNLGVVCEITEKPVDLEPTEVVPSVWDQRPALRPRRRPPAGGSGNRPLCRPRQPRAGPQQRPYHSRRWWPPRNSAGISQPADRVAHPATGIAFPQAFPSVRARSSSTRGSSLRRLQQSNIDGIATTACARWWSSPFAPTPQAATARIVATPLTIRARVTGGSSSEPGTGSCCTRSASSFADRFESD